VTWRLALAVLLAAALSAAAMAAPQGAQLQCAPGRPAGVTVLFVNGIWNSRAEAEASCNLVAEAIPASASVNVDLFYNRAVDDAWNDCVAAAAESRRAEAAGQSVDWVRVFRRRGHLIHNNSGIPLATGSAADVPLSIPRAAADCDQPEDLEEAWQQLRNVSAGYPEDPQPDALRLRTAIREELAAGRRVVVVAHSQGNLMFQEAVFAPGGLSRDERHRVAWLSLAAPHLMVDPDLGDAESVLLALDPIAGTGRNLTPAVDRIGGPTDLDRFFSRHLLTSYLTMPEARGRVDDALRRMTSSPSTEVAAVSGAVGRLLIVLDLSSSMNEHGKLAEAKGSVSALLDQVPAGYEVGVLTFGARCQVGSEPAYTTDVDVLRRRVADLAADGSTPLAQAMLRAAEAVQASAAIPTAVVVITDGQETCRGDVEAAASRLGGTLHLVAGAEP